MKKLDRDKIILIVMYAGAAIYLGYLAALCINNLLGKSNEFLWNFRIIIYIMCIATTFMDRKLENSNNRKYFPNYVKYLILAIGIVYLVK